MNKLIFGCFLVLVFGCAEYDRDGEEVEGDTVDICEPVVCATCEEVADCPEGQVCEECPNCELAPVDPCNTCFKEEYSKDQVKDCLSDLMDDAGLCKGVIAPGTVVFFCPDRCIGFDSVPAPVRECE